MIGGVTVEQIRRELDRVADRPADQLAEATTGRAAAGVEAGQLDPRVASPCPALATPGRTSGKQRRSGRPRLLRPFRGPSSRPRRRGSRRCRRFRLRSATRPRCGGSTAHGSRWPPAAAGREVRSESPSSPVIVKRRAWEQAFAGPSGRRCRPNRPPRPAVRSTARDDRRFMQSVRDRCTLDRCSTDVMVGRAGQALTAVAWPDRCRAWRPAS